MKNKENITEGMSAILKSLGFEAMAKQAVGETDPERLTKYARVIVKNSPAAARARLFELFNSQNLYPQI